MGSWVWLYGIRGALAILEELLRASKIEQRGCNKPTSVHGRSLKDSLEKRRNRR